MTAICASRPPASATKRLRMTRSRTLSSAPPMMITVPCGMVAGVYGRRPPGRWRMQNGGDGRLDRRPEPPGPPCRRDPARAATRGRRGSASRKRTRRDHPARRRLRPRDRRHVGARRARGRRRPGVLGRGPDLARGRRPLPPDAARSCPTSTPRGCCRCSSRGRCCRGTSPGSSGAARRSCCCCGRSAGPTPGARCRPRSCPILAFPIAGQPRHRQHQPAARARPCSAPSSWEPKAGGLIWGLATWMKWVPAAAVAGAPAEGARLGPRVPGRVRAAVARDAAAHDHPAPGAVRLRATSGPRRLPGVHLVRRAVVVAPQRPVRVPAPVVVARGRRLPDRPGASLVGVVARGPSRTTRLAWQRPASRSGASSGSRSDGGATGSPSPRARRPRRRRPPRTRPGAGRSCRSTDGIRPPAELRLDDAAAAARGGSTTGRNVTAATAYSPKATRATRACRRRCRPTG